MHFSISGNSVNGLNFIYTHSVNHKNMQRTIKLKILFIILFELIITLKFLLKNKTRRQKPNLNKRSAGNATRTEVQALLRSICCGFFFVQHAAQSSCTLTSQLKTISKPELTTESRHVDILYDRINLRQIEAVKFKHKE